MPCKQGLTLVESLSNEDGNVNKNVAKQWIKLAEYNHCTVGMQIPGHFSAVVFRNRTRKAQFSCFVENVNVRVQTNHFNLHAALKTKLLNFHIHTLSGKTKKTHELYKQENRKRKIKNSAAVFFDVPVPAA